MLKWNRQTVRIIRCTWKKPRFTFSPSTTWISKKGIQICQEDIDVVEQVLGLDYSPFTKYDEMRDLLKCYFQIHNLRMPTDWESALDFYIDLLKLLKVDDFLV